MKPHRLPRAPGSSSSALPTAAPSPVATSIPPCSIAMGTAAGGISHPEHLPPEGRGFFFPQVLVAPPCAQPLVPLLQVWGMFLSDFPRGGELHTASSCLRRRNSRLFTGFAALLRSLPTAPASIKCSLAWWRVPAPQVTVLF